MKKLTLDILDNLGNGKAKIITCNKETEAGDYLLGEVKEAIKGKINNCLFFDFYPEKYPNRNILGRLADIIDFCKDNRAVVLIHDLFFFHYPEAIINVFYGKNNIDGIITSDIEVSYKLKDKDTQVRGRYIRFFLAPMLYGDEIKSKDYHVKALENYGAKDAAIELYKYLVNHSGEVLSFRQVLEQTKSIDRRLMFYVDTINLMNKLGMIYLLKRVDVKDMDELSSGFVYYPTFISDIDLTDLPNEKKFKLKYEAFLVAKMFSENYMVNRAISYHADTIDGKYKSRVEFNRGFLIEYFNRKCIIKIDFSDNNEMIENFKKAKTHIPQMVAVLGHMELIVDKAGIAYYGLENLLEKGLKGYGGF
ncbi:MAG: hypothetical protein IJ194_02530 [Bacilli bacterium]|nr:hypothetical protein [Bacilli bacterium]